MHTNAVRVFDYEELPEFITRRDKKRLRQIKKSTRITEAPTPQLSIQKIQPLTENQARIFELFSSEQNLLLHGSAGTGKTFLALYLSLEAIRNSEFSRPIVILRSVVPSRDMGFLPGRMEDKISVYEEPYRGITSEICGKNTSYDWLKKNGMIQFSTTSFLRGITFRDNIIIVDEAQNCSGHELNTIMTRVGTGCKMIVCADFTQTDLLRNEERAGFRNFMKVAQNMKSFSHVEFTRNDIVRSDFVKEFIVTKENLGVSL